MERNDSWSFAFGLKIRNYVYKLSEEVIIQHKPISRGAPGDTIPTFMESLPMSIPMTLAAVLWSDRNPSKRSNGSNTSIGYCNNNFDYARVEINGGVSGSVVTSGLEKGRAGRGMCSV